MPNPKPAAIKAEIPKSIGRPGGGAGPSLITTLSGGGGCTLSCVKTFPGPNQIVIIRKNFITLTSIIRA